MIETYPYRDKLFSRMLETLSDVIQYVMNALSPKYVPEKFWQLAMYSGLIGVCKWLDFCYWLGNTVLEVWELIIYVPKDIGTGPL